MIRALRLGKLMRPPTLEETIAFLLDTPMFGDLDAAELASVVHILERRAVPRGHEVFKEGDPGEAWYVVFDGTFKVRKRIAADEHILASLTAGACFGEMAILDSSNRSAAVVANTDGTLFRFPRESFNELLGRGNLAAFKLVHQIALVLVARQRETTARLVELLGNGDLSNLHEELRPLVGRSAVAE